MKHRGSTATNKKRSKTTFFRKANPQDQIRLIVEAQHGNGQYKERRHLSRKPEILIHRHMDLTAGILERENNKKK